MTLWHYDIMTLWHHYDILTPRWSADLATCDLKKEYYTEIWSLVVSRDNRTVYTARWVLVSIKLMTMGLINVRDNEIIVADVNPHCETNGCKAFSDTNTVLVNYTLPGRAPVVLDTQEKVMVCPSRGGMDIQVWRSITLSTLTESGAKYLFWGKVFLLAIMHMYSVTSELKLRPLGPLQCNATSLSVLRTLC